METLSLNKLMEILSQFHDKEAYENFKSITLPLIKWATMQRNAFAHVIINV